MSEYINTDTFSARLRQKAILLEGQKILIAHLSGSEQEKDLSTPANCNGYGRIHHFRLHRHSDWSLNPLPIVPAAKALGYNPEEVLRAQVFQVSACNWRCWYCFVDFTLLSADPRVSKYFTARELIELYLEENNPPNVIDLTGGQPDLIPEWVLWMMEALYKHELEGKIFLWSDDNLSTRYFWKFLNHKQRAYIAQFPNYSRVCCFKGYDEASFTFNTCARPELFAQQFEIYQALLREGLDMYAYVTFTAIPHKELHYTMSKFVDKLQSIHYNLPLRMVPLRIETFTPTAGRIQQDHEKALKFQYIVHNVWLEEINKRFSSLERSRPISEIEMRVY